MLQHVGAEGRIHLLPAAQVSRSFVEQVAVARGQEVLHQDHRRADGNQQEEFTRPALVVVLRVLCGGDRKNVTRCLDSPTSRSHQNTKRPGR